MLLASCGGSPDESNVVVRVSAIAGVADFAPRPGQSGSSAAALDLVFDSVSTHADVIRVSGRIVTFRVRDPARFEVATLAARVRYQGLVSVEVTGADVFTATFIDEKTAAHATEPWYAFFDTGPYRLEEVRPDGVRLRRRHGGAIDAIEIFETTRADEWRKLMAREIDVIPYASSAYREELEGIGSIRIFDIPAESDAALYFNVRDPQLSDVALRRRIAASIHRKALARLVCDDERCAAPAAAAAAGELPAMIELSVVESDSALMIAARGLAYQLGSLGVNVAIKPTAVAELVAGRFQMALAPLTRGPHRYAGLRLSGFTSFDAALAADDHRAAQEIFEQEVPATILFEYRSFAAVDARLCGDVAPSSTSWRWIADLYPCEEAPP